MILYPKFYCKKVTDITVEFLNDNTDTELDELVLNFFKTFSSYISTYKNPSQKIKFSPK